MKEAMDKEVEKLQRIGQGERIAAAAVVDAAEVEACAGMQACGKLDQSEASFQVRFEY